MRTMDTLEAQEIHIESNVQSPADRVTYPFGEMEPGDSFFLPDQRRANAARVASIRYMQNHKPEWVFKLRRVSEGWRLWRVS